ncbi:MAG: lipoyl(octanoyl) transferase LipB [Candidatus Krumholzibacteria bacterium]|nr:lipoyl(octanoyl) transferase LipB [Candidatus Krumholzibacteria bacterium]
MRVCRVIDIGRMPYAQAFALQKREVARLQRDAGDEVLYLVEHPHVITVGRNATGEAILADRRLVEGRGVEIAQTDRGGDVTYHGPGQLVGYPLLRLDDGRRDIRRYVHDLEEMLIRALADFGIHAERHAVHRGVWTNGRKIASLGIRIARWVTSHGFAFNVSTDLSYFSLIQPCGIQGCEMTSIEREIGNQISRDEAIQRVIARFAEVFQREMIRESTSEAKVAGHV